jgi:DMSO/TMAO reductase YedYZ molybdopterin-dependent catalytic subunit
MDGSRRQFIGTAAGLAALAYLPRAKGQDAPAGTMPNDSVKAGKVQAMQWHSERPLTGSVPAHEHDFDITPTDRMFVRNNLLTPTIDPTRHRISIGGLVDKPLEFSLEDFKANFAPLTIQAMLECAGSGRSNYKPSASGTPWLPTGGMGCPTWTGARLRDVLNIAGIKPGAVHVAGQGGDPGAIASAAPVIRSIPLTKAMEARTLVAWEMNGKALPTVHGFPLRLVVPGWVGSASTKWLHTLTVLDAPFKGTYMDSSYRMPRNPVQPGEKMPEETVIAEDWPIKSMITFPAPNAQYKVGEQVLVTGRAWVGEGDVDRVEVSPDDGRSWYSSRLFARADKYAWRKFTFPYLTEAPGRLRFLARAWDSKGNAQPQVPVWNPLGYFWNGWHQVEIVVAA